MAKDPVEHQHAVLPPPPSTPDDGPSALDVPPLAAPPRSLQPARGGGLGSVPLRTWLACASLFVIGTVVTFLLRR
jgi:hypothetical protein